MSKAKSTFFCQQCGHESVKWAGQCPSCGQWNTFVEELVQKDNGKNNPGWKDYNSEKRTAKTVSLNEIKNTEERRLPTADAELNRVLGGGIVPGSLVLVAGEPGIGKSTLFLQNGLWLKEIIVLYISGEESEQQLKMRADRLGLKNDQFYLLTETSTQIIFQEIKKLKPQLVIVDSIQTLHTTHIESSPGSVSQIRECTAEFQRFAKETNTPVFLIGHITKDGSIAGPKILEHMVDTVLQFEGDRHYGFRILRAVKNRFGPASELGIFEMHNGGLREVTNPSEILLSQREEEVSGVAISAMIEGLRPMLVETQALVSTAAYGTPQRSGTGFDLRRLNMLLAVLEKRAGFRLSTKDVFLNIAGGLRVDDPAIDLAVIAAILSSAEDMPVGSKTAFAAEVGLSGEIRAVNRIESRISEAEKLGFDRIFISRYNAKAIYTAKYAIAIEAVGSVGQFFGKLFGGL